MVGKMKGNIYEKRERLKGALKLQWRIDKLRDQLADKRVTGGVESSQINDQPRSTSKKLSVEELVYEIEGQIEELEEEKKLEAELVRRQIINFRLSDREEKLMLDRYVRCLTWDDVADLSGYTIRHLHRLEDNILSKV